MKRRHEHPATGLQPQPQTKEEVVPEYRNQSHGVLATQESSHKTMRVGLSGESAASSGEDSNGANCFCLSSSATRMNVGEHSSVFNTQHARSTNFFGMSHSFSASTDRSDDPLRFYSRRPPSSSSTAPARTDASGIGDTIREGEMMLAEDLKSLSLDDRETVFEDVHGVKQDIQETPQLIDQSLRAMDREIKNVRQKEAYSKAAFLSPPTVQDVHLRLKILRSAQWQVSKAALMLTKYFEMKLAIFGEHRFLRPILWSDLDDDAQRSLQDGAVVRYDAPNDTPGGRTVLILNPASFHYKTALSYLQSMWYINATILPADVPGTHATGNNPGRSAASDRYDTQKSTISVFNVIGCTAAQMYLCLDAMRFMGKFKAVDSMPVRYSSNHLCVNDKRLGSVISLLISICPKTVRLRTRVHFGSPLECTYELTTYGVPSGKMPLDTDGTPRRELIASYLQGKREIEAHLWNMYMSKMSNPSFICFPFVDDILLGRGWPYQSYSGNIKLIELLETRKRKYNDASSRSEKTTISTNIMAELKGRGVRFVKRDASGNFWEEVSDTVARQKIAMCLRNISRR